jgi:hypothetical protein
MGRGKVGENSLILLHRVPTVNKTPDVRVAEQGGILRKRAKLAENPRIRHKLTPVGESGSTSRPFFSDFAS